MFRGKESSKRIELSQLVQDLLVFWAPCSSGGGWGCLHMHTCTHMRVVNMIISCKWPSPLGESLGISYDVICMCMHVRACAHGGVHPLTTPTPNLWGTPIIIQNLIALELIKIFQFCLKI